MISSRVLARLLLLILLGACVSASAERALSPDTGRLIPVRLALKWRHQFQFAGYYAALMNGYYRDEGLEVQLLEGGLDGTPAEAKLMRGEVELAVVGIAIFRHGNRR
ncbi:MAG TPA: ABC transporter substrate-binding protein, partial [Candidatus Ozemobacteraceae bacterium]|nr:ABC transporter substrate-binding protein [Candidatus Ozemobacteraceae bacterium]